MIDKQKQITLIKKAKMIFNKYQLAQNNKSIFDIASKIADISHQKEWSKENINWDDNLIKDFYGKDELAKSIRSFYQIYIEPHKVKYFLMQELDVNLKASANEYLTSHNLSTKINWLWYYDDSTDENNFCLVSPKELLEIFYQVIHLFIAYEWNIDFNWNEKMDDENYIIQQFKDLFSI